MSKTALLFSGQGAQYPGMMKEFYDTFTEVRVVFDIADKVLKRGIAELCFTGSKEELNLTHNTQPCLLAADLAAYTVFNRRGVKPSALAGFSLGEYAALVVAQAISIEDAFRLVQIRADAMQNAASADIGGMMVIKKCPTRIAVELCQKVRHGYVEPANYNQPMQISVSGDKEGLNELKQLAKHAGYKAVSLPVSAPFHCKLMQPAADELERVLKEIVFSDAKIPVYSNYDAQPTTSARELKEKLIQQVSSPVLWEQTLRCMAADGVDAYIELGPNDTLSKFVEKTLQTAAVWHVEDMETLNNLPD